MTMRQKVLDLCQEYGQETLGKEIDALLAQSATQRSGVPDAWLEMDHGQVIGVSVEKDLRSPFKWVPLYAAPLSETPAGGTAKVPEGMVLVSRSFMEATPCPNCDGSGFFVNTGPDPQQEQCQWCYEKHMILSGAERAPSPDGNEENKHGT